jgi:hypothetical protein
MRCLACITKTFQVRIASLTRNRSCDISIESPGQVGDESDDRTSITKTFQIRFTSLTRNWSCDISIESPGRVGDESDDPTSITKTVQKRYPLGYRAIGDPALYPSGERAATPVLYPIATLNITRYIRIRTLFSDCARGPCPTRDIRIHSIFSDCARGPYLTRYIRIRILFSGCARGPCLI